MRLLLRSLLVSLFLVTFVLNVSLSITVRTFRTVRGGGNNFPNVFVRSDFWFRAISSLNEFETCSGVVPPSRGVPNLAVETHKPVRARMFRPIIFISRTRAGVWFIVPSLVTGFVVIGLRFIGFRFPVVNTFYDQRRGHQKPSAILEYGVSRLILFKREIIPIWMLLKGNSQ